MVNLAKESTIWIRIMKLVQRNMIGILYAKYDKSFAFAFLICSINLQSRARACTHTQRTELTKQIGQVLSNRFAYSKFIRNSWSRSSKRRAPNTQSAVRRCVCVIAFIAFFVVPSHITIYCAGSPAKQDRPNQKLVSTIDGAGAK